MREEKEIYPQRTSELAAIDAGLEKNVKTYIVMSPTIYGLGTGSFNTSSIQLPVYIRTAISEGQPIVVGDGAGVWDYVHIADLVLLYEIILDKLLSGEDIPYGKKGIYFSATGRFSWSEAAVQVGRAGMEVGALKTSDVKSVSLDEAADKFGGLPTQLAEVFASKCVTLIDSMLLLTD